jgi:ribosome maturation factor RimP
MVNEQQIREMAEALLQSEAHFIVEVSVSAARSGRKVRVLLDGDEGASIDDCARLSRQLAAKFEEEEVFDDAYTLEVSTPGIDFPLETVRQYRKNLGRDLKVSLKEGKDVKGNLVEAAEEEITLEVKVGKGKNATMEKVVIPLSQVNKSIVQISFK